MTQADAAPITEGAAAACGLRGPAGLRVQTARAAGCAPRRALANQPWEIEMDVEYLSLEGALIYLRDEFRVHISERHLSAPGWYCVAIEHDRPDQVWVRLDYLDRAPGRSEFLRFRYYCEADLARIRSALAEKRFEDP